MIKMGDLMTIGGSQATLPWGRTRALALPGSKGGRCPRRGGRLSLCRDKLEDLLGSQALGALAHPADQPLVLLL